MNLEHLKTLVIEENWEPFKTLIGEPAYSHETKPATRELSFDENELLVSVGRDPSKNQSERAKELANGDSAKISRLKKKLINDEFLYEKAIKIGKGDGRPSKFLFLTDKGRDVVRKLGKKTHSVHGGEEHFISILLIEKQYSGKYRTLVDKWMGGDIRPDIYCEGNEEVGVVEVVRTNKSQRDLIKIRELAHKVDWVHIFFCSQEHLDHYRKTFRHEFTSDIFQKLGFFCV